MKKKILLVASLLLAMTCSACMNSGSSSSSSDMNSSTSSSISSSEGSSSAPEQSSSVPEQSSSEEPEVDVRGIRGTLEHVEGKMWGWEEPYCSQSNEIEGLWAWGATIRGEVLDRDGCKIPYEADNNTVTFSMKSANKELKLAVFLRYNGQEYRYNYETNAWYDLEGNLNSNITMTDEKGDDVNLGTLKYKGKWPWTVFTIKGVETDIVLIADYLNSGCLLEVFKAAEWNILDIFWKNEEIGDTTPDVETEHSAEQTEE